MSRLHRRSRGGNTWSEPQTSCRTLENQEAVPECTLPSDSKAASPFDRNDADIILRTCDRMLFQVHRTILVVASTVFEDMFSIPQPPDQIFSDRQVVDMTEDSRTLDAFLRLCYPTMNPPVEELSLLRNVLAAGVKYDSQVVVTTMKQIMMTPSLLQSHSFALFAIACYHGFEEEAQTIARYCADNSWVYPADHSLEDISAGCLYRLLQYVYGSETVTLCPAYSHQGVLSERNTDPTSSSASPPFTALSPGTDVVLKSRDSCLFHVHQTVIDLASPTMLGEIISNIAPEGATPLYAMRENGVCVDALLRLLYPILDTEITNLSVYRDVLRAAQKYKLWSAERIARSHWATFARDLPFSCYFLAIELAWKEEAFACAQKLLCLGSIPLQRRGCRPAGYRHVAFEFYIPEMESIGSRPYHYLLTYLDACLYAATANPLSISGLPIRPCGSPECQGRYPTAFTTHAPPDWLRDRFAGMTMALKKHPSGSVLSMDTALGQSFITVIANDTSICSVQTESLPRSSPKRRRSCSTSDNVRWALAVLRQYTASVDDAVSRVELVFN